MSKNNVLELGVDVDVKRAVDNLEALKQKYAEVARLARETNDKELSAAADKLADQIAKQRAEIEKSLPTLESFQAEMAGGLGNWRQFATVLGGAGGVIAGVAALTVKLAEGAATAERHQMALANLGSAYAQVSAATNDTVSAEQALHAQQSLTQSGLRVTGDELAVITRRAREYALATGTETTQALDQLTDALRGGEAEGLRRFGVTIAQGTDRTTAFSAAIAQLRHDNDATSPSARTLGEDIQHIHRGFTEGIGAMASWVTEATGLRDVIREVSSAFDTQATSAQAATHAVEEGVTRMMSAIATAQAQLANVAGAPSTNNALDVSIQGGANAATQDIYGRLGQLLHRTLRTTDLNAQELTQLQAVTQVINGSADDSSDSDRSNAMQAQQELLQHALFRIAEDQANQSSRDDYNAVSSGVQGLREQARQRRLQRRIRAEARRQGVELPGTAMQRDKKDHVAHEDTSLLDLMRRGAGGASNDSNLDALLASINGTGVGGSAETERSAGLSADFNEGLDHVIAASQTIKQSLEATGKEADGTLAKVQQSTLGTADAQNNALAQLTRVYQSSVELTETSAQRMANSVQLAFSSATGAFKSHVAALIEGRESFGEALRGFTHDVLVQVATESTVQAVFEGAKAIASIATNDYPGAALHAAAAGAYAATAAITGVGAALTNAPAASTAPTPASSTHASGARTLSSGRDGGSGGDTTVTINVSGLLGNEQTGNELARQMRDLGYRGVRVQR